MKIDILKVGIFQVNCYILENENELLCIDAGANFKKISECIDSKNKKLVGICLTHGHFDHIGAVDELVAKYNCPVYLSSEDLYLATHKEINFMNSRSAEITGEIFEYPVGKLKIGSFEFEIIDTPGHTEGSVCLLFDKCIFTGDTLFKNSVGRTDLYSSSDVKLKTSLKQIIALDYDLIVYPGHADSTTIKDEIENNPYL